MPGFESHPPVLIADQGVEHQINQRIWHLMEKLMLLDPSTRIRWKLGDRVGTDIFKVWGGWDTEWNGQTKEQVRVVVFELD